MSAHSSSNTAAAEPTVVAVHTAEPNEGTPGRARPGQAAARDRQLNVGAILSSIGETAYRWDIRSDRLTWASNAVEVLRLSSLSQVESASAFHLCIAPEHALRRLEAMRENCVSPAGEAGVPYRVQYRFLPAGRRSINAIWIEDQGRWYRGPDGAPADAVGVLRVIDDRREQERRLEYLSDHDQVTGLMNRSRLNAAIEEAAERARTGGAPYAFLMAAVDNLALTNETFGFEVGDDVIAAVGRRLENHLRAGDCIGRYSANKFGLIIADCNPAGLKVVAQRMLQAVGEMPIKTSGCRLSATASIGGVLIPEHADTVRGVTACALEALDDAKSGRSNNFAAYKPNLNKRSRRKHNAEVAEQVISALDENRMHIALQPIVDTHTSEARFHECLLRIEQPSGEIVSAGHFIPIAEQLGLSRLIDHRVLALSVARLRSDPDITLTMNVSGLTATDHDWLVALDRLTGGDRKLTNRLIIEITETAAIHDLDESANFVDTLKELGCRVAIDDFGAGYTSFHNLKFLGVDMVKIDGAFFSDLARDRDSQVFVSKLNELAAHFGMETVAEWVGSEETAAIVREMGINYMQGFLFGEARL